MVASSPTRDLLDLKTETASIATVTDAEAARFAASLDKDVKVDGIVVVYFA